MGGSTCWAEWRLEALSRLKMLEWRHWLETQPKRGWTRNLVNLD